MDIVGLNHLNVQSDNQDLLGQGSVLKKWHIGCWFTWSTFDYDYFWKELYEIFNKYREDILDTKNTRKIKNLNF